MTTNRIPTTLLRALGIVGWNALDPVVLAALATEAPLLIVGPHGSGKTLLLARLAEALQLRHRHYNASLLNFDDLVGFPVPENGKLVYLQTPATIWDAESVFFDEISRCRPDLQNKLFPIVHERIVQGLPLANLRFRWAAMNPPPDESGEGQDANVEYAGAEPLDVALADRFAFIVTAPSLSDLKPCDRLTVLRDQGAGAGDGYSRLAVAVTATRSRLDTAAAELRESAAEYTQLLVQHLSKAGHPVSTRRAVQIARNIVALRAATIVLDKSPSVEDAFYAAARSSLPDAAWGRPLAPAKLLAAHKAAWEVARLKADAPARELLTEPNPIRRLASALFLAIPAVEAGQVVADSFAALPRAAQLAAAAVFMPVVSHRTDLPAATIEPLAQAHATLARQGISEVTVRQYGPDWRRALISQGLPTIDTRTKRGRAIVNAAIALLEANEPADLASLAAAYDEASAALAEASGRSTASPARPPRRRRA